MATSNQFNIFTRHYSKCFRCGGKWKNDVITFFTVVYGPNPMFVYCENDCGLVYDIKDIRFNRLEILYIKGMKSLEAIKTLEPIYNDCIADKDIVYIYWIYENLKQNIPTSVALYKIYKENKEELLPSIEISVGFDVQDEKISSLEKMINLMK